MVSTLEAGWHVKFDRPVNQVSFSPDGKRIAVAFGLGEGPAIVVLDVASGDEVARCDDSIVSAGGADWIDNSSLFAPVMDDLGWCLLRWAVGQQATRVVRLEGTGYTNARVDQSGRWLALVRDGVELRDLTSSDATCLWQRNSQRPLWCRAAWDGADRLWASNLDDGAILGLSAEGQELLRFSGPSAAGDTEVLVVDGDFLFAVAAVDAASLMVSLSDCSPLHEDFFGPGARTGAFHKGPSDFEMVEVSATSCLLNLETFDEALVGPLFRSVVRETDRHGHYYGMGSVDGDVAVVFVAEES
jgi:hypothetical protein